MKVQLKNGVIIECTVDEWLKIQNDPSQWIVNEPEKVEKVEKPERVEKVVIVQSKTKTHQVPRKFHTWTQEQQRILLANADLHTKKIMKLIPGKTASAINCRLSLYKIKRNLKTPPKQQQRKKYELNEETKDIRRKRFQWVAERAKSLVKLYQYSYEKAKNMAITEYDSKVFLNKEHKEQHKEIQKNIIMEEFPVIYPLHTKEGLSQFEGVLKNLFSRESGTIGYYDIKWISGVEWSGRVWHDFLVNIFSDQKEIFEYFMMDASFRIEKDGNGYEVLRYTKGGVRNQEGDFI